jgi:hypothetical protein
LVVPKSMPREKGELITRSVAGGWAVTARSPMARDLSGWARRRNPHQLSISTSGRS